VRTDNRFRPKLNGEQARKLLTTNRGKPSCEKGHQAATQNRNHPQTTSPLHFTRELAPTYQPPLRSTTSKTSLQITTASTPTLPTNNLFTKT